MPFSPWWPWPLMLTFKPVWVRDKTRLPCEFGANPFSGSRDISYTNKETTAWWHQKQNIPQFTACGNKNNRPMVSNYIRNVTDPVSCGTTCSDFVIKLAASASTVISLSTTFWEMLPPCSQRSTQSLTIACQLQTVKHLWIFGLYGTI